MINAITLVIPLHTGLGSPIHLSGSLKKQLLTLPPAVLGHVVDVQPDDHQVRQNVIDGRVGLHTHTHTHTHTGVQNKDLR